MYKAYLVDDEPWILVGLCKTFNWKKYHFEIIGQSTDPFTALEDISHLKPDLVVLDIRMPEINGIDLMKRAREEGLHSEFVFVSGFAEFHYAQEALRYGAFDYLLKPIEAAEAERVLNRLYVTLERRRLEKDIQDYEALLERSINVSSFLDKRGLKHNSGQFQAVSVASLPPIQASGFFDSEGISYIKLLTGNNKEMFVVNCQNSIEGILVKWLSSNENLNEQYVSLSSVSSTIMDIPKLVLEADICSYNLFVNSECRLAVYKKTGYEELNGIVVDLNQAITGFGKKDIKQILSTIPCFFVQNNLGMNEAVYLWNQCAALLHQKFGDKAVKYEIGFSDYRQIHDRFQSLLSMCDYLIEVSESLLQPFKESMVLNQSFKNLLEYINEHHTKNLQLKALASKFHMNVSYCCELFRKHTGKNFSDYLIGLRLGKASELLRNSNFPIQEICAMTGYSDYYYFNKSFKKCFGVSPAQYRNVNKQEN